MHGQRIIAVAIEAAQVGLAELVVRKRIEARNRKIIEALEAGDSDRAVAIAANMSRTAIHGVKLLLAPDVYGGPFLIHAVNAFFPCCRQEVRFARDIDEETVTRRCQKCGRRWRINRRTIAESVRGRVDLLSFEQLSGEPIEGGQE